MTKQVCTELPDWTREELATREWAPGWRPILSSRANQRYRHASGGWTNLLDRWFALRQSTGGTGRGQGITLNGRIGGGLLISQPNGNVIHPDAQIGANCLIIQQVTLWAKTTDVVRRFNWRNGRWRAHGGQKAQP